MSVPASGSPDLAAGAGSGVIHDIGYRHYDGPRLGRGYVVRSLFLSSLLGAYGIGRSVKSKVMPFLLLTIMCVPAIIIVAAVVGLDQDELPIKYTTYPVVMQAVIAIFVAAQSPQLVSRDLRFRLTSLYFSRPLLRSDYVLAKFAAMTSALLILIALPLTILFGGALLAKLPPAAETRHYLQGLAGAMLFALVLAAVGLLLAAFTPRRGLGVAAIIAVLLVSFAAVVTVQGIAATQGEDTVVYYAGLFSPFSLVDGVQVWLFGGEFAEEIGPPGRLVGPVFLAVTAAVVAGAYALLLLRYRRVSVS